ncbi:MAG TPA: glycosyltransferase family 2 protein [Candidatus Acidoferrum sp.]|nr:glycosyltransferase family 2 protein [Candidatus Acidoferrum sp.]
MKSPFFTVLIDAYNYGQYIEEAVASALEQNFPEEEREILVVDDGSTDDTEERLHKFGEAIRYFKKTNGGQASAFNCGFEQARGQVIALLDADDVWLPDKLGHVYEAFERYLKAAMVYNRVHLWDGAHDISEDAYFTSVSGRVTENRRVLLQYPMVGTSCLAFRREAVGSCCRCRSRCDSKPTPRRRAIEILGRIKSAACFPLAVAAYPYVWMRGLKGTYLYCLARKGD